MKNIVEPIKDKDEQTFPVNTFIPFISLGPFKFNERINKYLKLRHEIIYYPSDEFDNHPTFNYYFPDFDLDVYIDQKQFTIDSVQTESSCYYNGTNLIGLSYNGLMEVLKTEPEEIRRIYLEHSHSHKHTFTIYDFFDSFGLEIWTWRNKVDSIFSFNIVYDESDTEPFEKNAHE